MKYTATPDRGDGVRLVECENRNRFKTVACTPHNLPKKVVFECGKCEPCLRAWGSRNMARIIDGLKMRPGRTPNFTTITMCEGTGWDGLCGKCFKPNAKHRSPADVTAILIGWRRFRRSSWYRRRYGADAFWRTLEKTKKGSWHLHLICYDDLPNIKKARNGESISSYLGRQSSEALQFIQKLTEYGLGIITHIEPVKSTKGIAWYLGAYITKVAFDLENATKGTRTKYGTATRIVDCSKGWRDPRIHPTHRYYETDPDTIPNLDELPESLPCDCEAKDSQTNDFLDTIVSSKLAEVPQHLIHEYHQVTTERSKLYATRQAAKERAWVANSMKAEEAARRIILNTKKPLSIARDISTRTMIELRNRTGLPLRLLTCIQKGDENCRLYQLSLSRAELKPTQHTALHNWHLTPPTTSNQATPDEPSQMPPGKLWESQPDSQRYAPHRSERLRGFVH